MKTIKEWLETIADPTIREAAISQIDESNSMWPEDGMAKSLADALLSFNDWDKTKELRIHWRNISNLALRGQLETREVETTKKKVKIWIEVYEEDGLVKTLIHNTRDNLDTSVAELEDERAVLLEVIEREYEI